MEGFTVNKAAEMSGMTTGQVSNAIFHGLVKPEFHTPEGSGDQARLGKRNIRELILIDRMRRAGLRADTVIGIINLLAESKLDWWKGSGNHVIVTNEKWFVTDNAIADLKRMRSDYILVFRLD